jgi:hypothetical protein
MAWPSRTIARHGAVFAAVLALFFAPGAARGAAPAQEDPRTCLVCHDDAELKSSDGRSAYVSSGQFTASLHGRAGVGCVGCHADLKSVDEFPHTPKLDAVTCARCHEPYGRTSPAGVHGTFSPRLAARPVSCKDCHGTHDILPSIEPASSVHAGNRPATCGKCHSGAGANLSRGRVHDLAAAGPSPAGVVRVLYKIFIGVMTAFFVLYAGVDLLCRKRTQWTKKS